MGGLIQPISFKQAGELVVKRIESVQQGGAPVGGTSVQHQVAFVEYTPYGVYLKDVPLPVKGLGVV